MDTGIRLKYARKWSKEITQVFTGILPKRVIAVSTSVLNGYMICRCFCRIFSAWKSLRTACRTERRNHFTLLHDQAMGLSRLIQSLKVRSPTVKDVPIQVSIREVEKPSPTSSSSSSSAPSLSTQQRALILFGPRQPYEEISDHPTPSVLNDRELLVRNRVIGLNPIDWKAP